MARLSVEEQYMQDTAAEMNCEFAYCATPLECAKFDDCYARAVQQIESRRDGNEELRSGWDPGAH